MYTEKVGAGVSENKKCILEKVGAGVSENT